MDNAQLIIEKDVSCELPIHKSVCGADVIDINPLTTTDYFSYDPGFSATASCESKITYIDGVKGILRYRGYPIEQLAQHSTYLETCYLLFFGERPTAEEAKQFANRITQQLTVSSSIQDVLNNFDSHTHPMAMLSSLTSVLAGIYHDDLNITNPDHRLTTAINLVAKLPTIAAMCYQHSRGKMPLAPQKDLSYAENFLYMMGDGKTPINPIFIKALDLIFILHADHEQNASTSTVRLAGSSGANPYACIAAGMASLWGAAHGGANESVLKMLIDMDKSGGELDVFIIKAKDKNDPFRLMGFGHRVYKNFDPRAKIIRKMCYDVLQEMPQHDNIFKLAQELETVALKDDYFIEKKLYPNVDFYSGIIMRALGIPTNMFTVMFALGRSIGWISHWNEMHSQTGKIGRPRQLYTGYAERDYAI